MASIWACWAAQAEASFPNKTVNLAMAFAAGSGPDDALRRMAGKIRFWAVAVPKRISQMSDITRVAEAGEPAGF